MNVVDKCAVDVLKNQIEGELYTDLIYQTIYATDASAYKEYPLAVCYPKSKNDIKDLIEFSIQNKTSLIPRAAGTSLAGQVVGGGIVVDISKYMNQILEVNAEKKWIRVQPGVVLDELNKFLEPYGLFFAPETSTANRCMIGGMVGNNACGSHSLIYGSTRDHLISVKCILSDGSEVCFNNLSKEEFHRKTTLNTLEGDIYRQIKDLLSDSDLQNTIRSEYPDSSIKRRNTGYALDLLMNCNVFDQAEDAFNFSKLIAGSEGTLAFITEITLQLIPLPPREVAVMAAHFHTKEEAFKANLVALKHAPGAVEMMDHVILELTKDNSEQTKNRFFIEGEPAAILIIEFARHSKEDIEKDFAALKKDFINHTYGYHFPVIYNQDTKKVWNLRKAGLGLLSNMKGDAKPVSVIEDTAVNPEVLPDYMSDFQKILDRHHLDCVYHAHIGTGELHLRPILNLKAPEDVELFYTLGKEIAFLVKKYKGSLSGEHGDGRLRGEFIPIMYGSHLYRIFEDIKRLWDPNRIFNPEKIVSTPKMNSSLRYEPGVKTKEIDTLFDFSSVGGYLRAIEKCNGSGDCRKSALIGGTMCPTYMATKDENKTTRARANALREFLSKPADSKKTFDQPELKEILDLCISCKGCKNECPSSVDMAKLKAEFLQHYYDIHGIPFRSRLVAYLPRLNVLASLVPGIANFLLTNKLSSNMMMNLIGFESKRSMPLYAKKTLKSWFKSNRTNAAYPNGTVYLFNDEFTNFNDTEIGKKGILLLQKLGYEVIIPEHSDSGRTYISKGLIRTAKKIANRNILALRGLVSEKSPLIGIEPSAILSFRDEYTDLALQENKEAADYIAKNTFLIEEFLMNEIEKGKIKKEQFTREKKHIKVHGHCQQKAVASTKATLDLLSFPENYSSEEIPSGCCGMAGAFGYEKEHYELSMKIGELVLFPEIRKSAPEVLISAPGTSCRHQIKDGTQKTALHPVEILYQALNQ